MKVAKYNPIAGRAYDPLPAFLANKKSIINIKNANEKCFGFWLTAFFQHQEREKTTKHDTPIQNLWRNKYIRHVTREMTYDKDFESFGLNELTYPVDPISVPHLEEKFQLIIILVIFHDDEGRARRSLYIFKKNYQPEVEFLYWEGHYAWIKSFSGFLCDLT